MATTKNISVTIPVDDDLLDDYVREAVMRGFVRNGPKEKWDLKEKKEAFRYIVRLWHIGFRDFTKGKQT